MRRRWLQGALAGGLLLAAGPGRAQTQARYVPERGQSAQQAEQDQYACYEHAKQQSGFDPVAAGLGEAPAKPGSTVGSAARGAAVGTAVGVLGGAIFHHPVTGAAAGAAAGTAVGAVRGHQHQQRAQAQEQQVAAYQQAEASCMASRGYATRK